MGNIDQKRQNRISPPPSVVKFHYRQVLSRHKQRLRDELKDIDNYTKDPLVQNPPNRAQAAGRKGAFTSALFKQKRRWFVSSVIDETIKYHELDMTMTSAALVFRKAMGFTPPDDYLAKRYGTTGRTASSKTELLNDDQSEMLVAFGESLNPVVRRLEEKMRKQLKDEKRKFKTKQGIYE